jgi:hypothetical protein
MTAGSAPPSLRAALERLLKDPALAAALGRRAVERVRVHYSWDRVTDAYERLFYELREGDPMTLGKRRAEWVLRLLAADVVVLLVAFLVAYRLRVALDGPIGRPAAPLGYYLWLLGLIVPMWVGLLAASGAYGMGWTTRSRFWLALRVSVVGLLALTAGLFLGKAEEVNRSVLLLFSGVSAVALWAERGLVLGWLRHSAGASAGRASPSWWARETAPRGSSPLSCATRRRAGSCAAA